VDKFKILSFLSEHMNTEGPSEGQYQYLKDLYLGDGLARRVKKIRRTLEKGEDPGLCFLILSTSEADQLDIIETKYLLQDSYRKRKIRVVGIASDGEEAKLILIRMMQDCIHRSGTADLRAYLEGRLREEVNSG